RFRMAQAKEVDEVAHPAGKRIDDLRRSALELQGRAQAVEESRLLGANGWQSEQEGFLFAPLPPLPTSSGVQIIRLTRRVKKKLDRGAPAPEKGREHGGAGVILIGAASYTTGAELYDRRGTYWDRRGTYFDRADQIITR